MRSRPCGERWHEHLRGRSPVADRGMRPDGVVVPSPTLDDDLGLAQGVEDLAIEKLAAEPRIKAFDVPVLPRADVGGLCADSADPIPHRLGDEPGAVIRTDVRRHAAWDEQVLKYVDDIDRFEPGGYPNGQALMGKLVDVLNRT